MKRTPEKHLWVATLAQATLDAVRAKLGTAPKSVSADSVLKDFPYLLTAVHNSPREALENWADELERSLSE